MVKRDIVQNILVRMSTECFSWEQTDNSVESDPGQVSSSPAAPVSSFRVAKQPQIRCQWVSSRTKQTRWVAKNGIRRQSFLKDRTLKQKAILTTSGMGDLCFLALFSTYGLQLWMVRLTEPGLVWAFL